MELELPSTLTITLGAVRVVEPEEQAVKAVATKRG